MPRGIYPGHVAAFFAAFSGSGILLETVHHSYLVFYWKPCCIPIWYFIGNRAASLFGILLETVLHPYLVFYLETVLHPYLVFY